MANNESLDRGIVGAPPEITVLFGTDSYPNDSSIGFSRLQKEVVRASFRRQSPGSGGLYTLVQMM